MRTISIPIFFMVILLSGCVVSHDETVVISQPITTVADKVTDKFKKNQGKPTTTDAFIEAPRTLAILPFTNATEEQEAPVVLRTVIGSHLSFLNTSIMHPQEVDDRLPADYLTHPDLASYLGVDAVLTGEVVEFERFFAGVYSHIKLGVVLKLHGPKDKLIWETSEEVTVRAGGVSTSPWGLLLNAAVAAMHLTDENLFAAADKLSRQVVASFPQPESYASSGPYIESVLHDAAGKHLKYGDTISVGIKGDKEGYASVEVGNIEVVELKEIEPGTYIGTIDVSSNWNQENVLLTGRLRNANGTVRKKISAVGLVNFDNIAPNPVDNVALHAYSGKLKATWAKSAGAERYQVINLSDGKSELLQETTNNYINIPIENSLFETLSIAIVALDKSGNMSQTETYSVTVYPLEVGDTASKTSTLSGTYNDSVLLTSEFSPYVISDPVVLSETSRLFVEPGVELQFAQAASLEIKGDAYFWGTRSPIKIQQQNNASPTNRFIVINSSKTLQLGGISFSDAGQALVIKKGSPVLSLITMENSRFSGLEISGDAKVEIDRCLIDGSNTSGVIVTDYARLKMTNCQFKNNQPFHIQSSSVYEVIIENSQWSPAASASTILGNVKYH